MVFKFQYTDKELTDLLRSLIILVDTREQQNQHITAYFDSKGIPYQAQKLDFGDYAACLPANEALGIPRPVYFPAAIERKNSVDELAATVKERTRFENELIRAQGSGLVLLIEDANGYQNIITGNYRSQYSPKALLGSLKSFESRYGFQAVFVAPQTAGNYIYWHFYYTVRNALK